MRQLFRIPAFWILGLAYGAITGIFSGWLAFLLPNLNHFLDAQKAERESGWLGFYSTIAGCVAGILASKLADVLKGRMKLIIIVRAWIVLRDTNMRAAACGSAVPHLMLLRLGLMLTPLLPPLFKRSFAFSLPS